MTVYRGVVLDRTQIARLRRYLGSRLPTRSHAWWATSAGVARVYATTSPVRERSTSRELFPVLLTGELSCCTMAANLLLLQPTLPDLRAYPQAHLLLTNLEVLV